MRSSYALGLFFIFLVSVIWSVASIVVQYLYHDQNFHSPFLLTYIGTSLFVTLLPTRFLWERRRRIRRFVCRCFHKQQQQSEEELEMEIIPWRNSTTYQVVPSAAPVQERTDNQNTSSQNDDQTDVKSSIASESKQQSDAVAAITSERLEFNTNHRNSAENGTSFRLLSHEEHIKMALKIAPLWFLANWCYNTSLAFTSITSSTVLASTGSLFTFLFAVSTRDEGFTYLKLSGVLLGISGSVLTGLHDVHSTGGTVPGLNDTGIWNATDDSAGSSDHDWENDQNPVLGDIFGLLSAVGYGAYTVMIRHLCPRNEEAMSMQFLLGYVGLLNGLVLLPIAAKLILSPGNDTTASGSVDDDTSTWTAQPQQLTWVVFGYLVAKGMLDNVLSDYLWARAVVLTSATVATVGLGLTIPLAFVSDWVLRGHENVLSVQSVLGALAVLCGFILVNVDGQEEGEARREETSSAVVNEDCQAMAQGVTT